MTFCTNFSSTSKSTSFYKRTSSPTRRRRGPLAESQADAQYEKWCEYLQKPPKRLRVRGRSSVPSEILAGHFVSTESLTEDGEECYDDADAEERYEGRGDVWSFIYDPVRVEEYCDLNEDIIPQPSSDIYENPRIYDEDVKFYKKTFKKRHKPKDSATSTDEKEGLERRLEDRLKVLFSKHSDWLKKTMRALKNKDQK
ncbi:unnamed protein product [Callosobruchus maculatus]|uniref:Uncharacterized protein n=1 Tax=Callosobruchus maculatus TaxID=64391 RepID=A0A653BVE8_CALMS|nr:unnamed protein product [Callosobruchus maculatus]